MRKMMITGSIVCFFAMSATIQTQAQSFMDPVFTPEVTVVDFGEVDSKTDSGYRILKFTNTGNAPLLISKVDVTCGCTVPKWPAEPIPAGGTNEITIKYDVKNRLGTFDKTITITTNEPDGKDADGNVIYKQHKIQIKGNVK